MLQNGDKKWQASQAWWYLIVQEKKLSSTLKLQKLQFQLLQRYSFLEMGTTLSESKNNIIAGLKAVTN